MSIATRSPTCANTAVRVAHGIAEADLACPWLHAVLARKEVPSRQAMDRLVAAGFCGAIVPSFVPAATDANANLVLWRWGPNLPHRVAVYDPSGRLPKSQLSWPDLA